MRNAPVQVYINVPLDTPEFTHLSDAEQFLAKVAALVAHGQLDFQAGQNLSALTKNWIDAQYARNHARNGGMIPPFHRPVCDLYGAIGVKARVLYHLFVRPDGDHLLVPT